MEIKYLIDFDSTLVSLESLDELARLALEGDPEKNAKLAEFHVITSDAMSGRVPFDEALERRLGLFTANREHVAEVTEILKDSITDSALEYADWFEENADNVFVVSCGFEDYIIPVVAELGIPASHVFANKFEYDSAGNIIGFDRSRNLAQRKGKALQAQELELAGPIVMIGDGMADYEVRASGLADEFWVFTQHAARPSVVERADRVLPGFDEIEDFSAELA